MSRDGFFNVFFVSAIGDVFSKFTRLFFVECVETTN